MPINALRSGAGVNVIYAQTNLRAPTNKQHNFGHPTNSTDGSYVTTLGQGVITALFRHLGIAKIEGRSSPAQRVKLSVEI